MDKYNFVFGLAVCKNSRLFATRFQKKESSIVDGGIWEQVSPESDEIGDSYLDFPELAHYEKVVYIALVADSGVISCYDPSCLKVFGLGYIDGSTNAFNEFINCSDSVIFE